MSAAGGGKRVLIVGSGGREHALAWKLAQSPQVGAVLLAPGNDGMPGEWERWELKLSEGKPAFAALALRAREAKIDLTVIGPDDPLASGIVDVFERHGLAVFGPTQAAARIEWSKGFAKEVMTEAGVPTARFVRVDSLTEAHKFLKSVPWPKSPSAPGGWVIKADGLALGKGVVVCLDFAEAARASEELLKISPTLVIEERLEGEELSWMAFCDGQRCALLEPARDYKRIGEGDSGPNTGGMGAISPVPGVPAHFAERVRNEVFLPTLRELSRRGALFRGLLYAGLMVDVARDRIWVIEFNSRFGDPEAQVLLPRIEDDLYLWLEATARGDLSALPMEVPFSKKSAVVVVGAAGGYPSQPEKGVAIPSSHSGPGHVFWAGVKKSGDGLVTAGGRVLGATAWAASLEDARAGAFQTLQSHAFARMQFRRDIGGSPR